MPLTVSPARTKRIPFLGGAAIATIAAYQTYDTTLQILALFNGLVADEKRPAASREFFEGYATCVIMTQDIEFKWDKKMEVPDELFKFQVFWQKVLDGQAAIICFDYFAMNVGTWVYSGGKFKNGKTSSYLTGWHDAVIEGQAIWSPPPEWKLEDELTEEEKSDPS